MTNPNWKKCVICGDSKDIIKRIPDNSIDFILTDPPYNIGKHSTGNIPLPGRSALNNDVHSLKNNKKHKIGLLNLDIEGVENSDEAIRIREMEYCQKIISLIEGRN